MSRSLYQKLYENNFPNFLTLTFFFSGIGFLWSIIFCLTVCRVIFIPLLSPIFSIKIFGSIIGFSFIYLIINFVIYLLNRKSLGFLKHRTNIKYFIILLINSTLYGLLLSPLYFIIHYVKIPFLAQIFVGVLYNFFSTACYISFNRKKHYHYMDFIYIIFFSFFLLLLVKVISWLTMIADYNHIEIFSQTSGILLSSFFFLKQIHNLEKFYESIEAYKNKENLVVISNFGAVLIFNELINLFTVIFYLIFSFLGYDSSPSKKK